MRRLGLVAAAAALLNIGSACAALITYNSGDPSQNATARTNFYRAVGVLGPQFRLDFETGFADEQNIAGQPLTGGLVLRGSNGNNQAVIQQGPGSISLSNPVGQFAVAHTPMSFSGLILDFSASPVDYVAYQDIDTTSNNSIITLVFVGGSTQNFFPDATFATGDSAEFLGFFRNDLPRIREVRFLLSGDAYGIDNIEYGLLTADFNNDAQVDAADLTLWQAGFGKPSGATALDGDADQDGDADGNDFLLWQRQQNVPPPSLAAAVPEPAAYAIAASNLFAVLATSRRFADYF